MIKSGDIDSLVKENIWLILTMTLIAMVIQNTFTVIPLILVITINYVLFGFVNGFIWSWFTSIIGSAIVFVSIRYLFRDWVTKKVDRSLLFKIEQKGFSFVFQSRIIPFIPTSLINILGGISSIHFKSFMSATSLGNFLYFFVMILIPAGLISIPSNESIVIYAILLSILLIFFFRFIKRRRKANKKLSGE
ncbi:TVP38/TMEM64 family protein [Niallia sp. Krafla_26]|uniref:TVP38/TMEM64 family protein n=1 Tax=Niallia sp. Krafla_26 TaxID=3064703 RepID=UPI003D174B71